MKAIAFAATATLLGFAAGLLGTYQMSPTIRALLGKEPMVLDAAVLATIAADAGAGAEPLAQLEPDSLAADTTDAGPEDADTDAFGIEEMLEEGSAEDEIEDAAEAGDAAASNRPVATAVREGKAALRQNRAQIGEVKQLARENDALRNEVLSIKRQRAEATELSKTLVRLEDRELRQVLGQLDLGTLEVLYGQVSLRNRIRLLQNMPPEKAAGFIQQLTDNNPSTVLSEYEEAFAEPQ